MALTQITGEGLQSTLAIGSEGGAVTTSVQQGLAKVWINFDGTGTIAARDSLNISSQSDDGTGLYTMTYTNAFNNDDYVGSGLSRTPSVASGGTAQFPSSSDSNQTTTSAQHYTVDAIGGSATDFSHNHIIIHGDLA